jgi:hypothetical protein
MTAKPTSTLKSPLLAQPLEVNRSDADHWP